MASKHLPKTLKSVLRLFNSESKEIGIILIYGIGVGCLSLAVPIGVQALVSTVTFGALSQPVVFLVAAVFVGLLLAAACRTLQVFVVEQLQRRFFCYTALDLAERLTRVKVDHIHNEKFPELVNRFFDVLVVQKSTSTLLLEGFAVFLQAVIGLVLLAFYNPALLAFDLGLILSMGFILFGLGKGAVRSSIEESEQKYRVVAWLEEIAAKSLSFKDPTARNLAIYKADELVGYYLNSRDTHFKILLRQVVGILGLQALASAMLLGLGAILVTKNQLTLGQLVAAEIVVTNVLNSLARFQKHLEAFYDLATGLNKVDALMELPIEEQAHFQTIEGSGPARVSLNNVSFAYERSRFILTPVTMEIPRGSRVGIVGANGTGKSTLVDILYALKRTTTGSIAIDGVDYRDAGTNEIRKHVGIVRGVEIFSSSLLENVLMGRPDLTINDAKDALAKVGLLNEVMRLPEGLHTILGENGSPLSVSHAQKLMVARAIVRKPRLLLIDESLDAIDSKSASLLLNELFHPSAPWTVVLSSCDPQVLRQCDLVISLDNQLQGSVA